MKWLLIGALYFGSATSVAQGDPSAAPMVPASGAAPVPPETVESPGSDPPVAAGAWNRPWHELDFIQQARARATMPLLGPRDEPPFPAKGLVAALRVVASVQRPRSFTSGTTIQLDVDAEGRVANAANSTPVKRAGGAVHIPSRSSAEATGVSRERMFARRVLYASGQAQSESSANRLPLVKPGWLAATMRCKQRGRALVTNCHFRESVV